MEAEDMNTDWLKKYALLRGLNVGQAEKDYYQTIILFSLYGIVSKELIFKGGTALSKCYGLNRFSEDLDFTVSEEKDFISIISSTLKDFSIEYIVKEVRTEKPHKKYKLKIKGPLYTGSDKTLCSITLDFSFRESVLLEPNIVTIGHHLDVIPSFDVYVMAETEIFAEKVRALFARDSARDLYDLAFLVKKGVTPDYKIINKKLEWSRIVFDKKIFLSRCNSLKSIWQSELRSLVKNVPSFEDCVKTVFDVFGEPTK